MTYDRPKKKKGQGKWEAVRTVEMSLLSGITHYIDYIFFAFILTFCNTISDYIVALGNSPSTTCKRPTTYLRTGCCVELVIFT